MNAYRDITALSQALLNNDEPVKGRLQEFFDKHYPVAKLAEIMGARPALTIEDLMWTATRACAAEIEPEFFPVQR